MCTKTLILGQKLADALKQLCLERVRDRSASPRSNFFNKFLDADCFQTFLAKDVLRKKISGEGRASCKSAGE
jgi:hypothetical protein